MRYKGVVYESMRVRLCVLVNVANMRAGVKVAREKQRKIQRNREGYQWCVGEDAVHPCP